mmetsp:Transcript_3320/g.9539  ORF Transcript_3320/g.9539 Transcript_3320/m.9539 type:complete len:119 (+) Transcript_3320:433-789(+)
MRRDRFWFGLGVLGKISKFRRRLQPTNSNKRICSKNRREAIMHPDDDTQNFAYTGGWRSYDRFFFSMLLRRTILTIRGCGIERIDPSILALPYFVYICLCSSHFYDIPLHPIQYTALH